jgi:purine-nucleoside/S-methyl-5'-thioadenosine phosphorylase / adenosine deaminase
LKGFLFFDPLKGLDFIAHGFSTKYQGFGSAEEALNGLGLKGMASVVPKQVHGTDFVIVKDGKTPVRPVADGAMTNRPGVVLVVKVSDCVPIFMVDPQTPAIAMVHAGWRGASQAIASKAIRRMQETFGTEPSNLVAALGPSIQKCCYEVGEEVAIRFPESVRRCHGEKWQLDLAGANVLDLESAGVLRQNIHVSPHCTCCEPRRFHSYRRDRKIAGRHYAVLALNRVPETPRASRADPERGR